MIHEEIMEFMDEVNTIVFQSTSEKPTKQTPDTTSENIQVVHQTVEEIISWATEQDSVSVVSNID